ncbi:MAG: hypothetical protein A2076_08220 [Geobacteraceae bacterium GWC2_53_11]|nr:MAG: hypothetical protein A2076_08220 [Geobacteraceae bacterium GWC2_53_11]
MTTLLTSHEAAARLSGDASLTYTSYEGQSASSRVSSNSLVQNYSLLYSSQGPLYNSRVGSYDVSLGYNWTALDTTFKSSGRPNDNFNETRGHLMYNGEIKLDPKEVPFKLNAYSRDMTRNSIATTANPVFENFGSMVGNRDQATGINDGLHIESGATLIAGVKNGMTNGYNEILRHFPMILFDYKDVMNRDLRSQNPVDDRLSRLAFVSLNKKDNWFHYRHTLFEDYIDSKNNYVENEVQLGTVDQNLVRRWIDFSNWLRVSTDLQLSKRKSNYQASSLEEINLNLFVGAERKYWNARTFTTFNRSVDENQKLSYQTTLPLYASGVVSQDLSWDARTSFRNVHDKDVVGVSSRFTAVLAGYRVNAYKRALFSLTQNSEVEVSESNTSRLVTLSAGVETTSSSRFSRAVSLGASYNIKNSVTSSDTMSSSNFVDQRLMLHVAYAPTNTLRFDVSQINEFTNGNYTQFNSTASNSATLLSQYVNPRSLTSAETGSNSYHSLSRLMASWNPRPRLDTNLTLNEDIYKSSVQKLSMVTDVQANVTYTNDAWSVSDSFGYSRGDRYILDDNARTISNTATLKYIHSRNLDGSASVSYSETQSDGANLSGTEVIQKLNYYHFTRSGVMRKLFEFNETLTYSDGFRNTTVINGKTLLLGLKYYPISQLTLAAGAGYTYTTSLNDYTLVWNAAAVANFRLLQVSLDYINGFRKADGVKENKFTGNIRKSF